MHTANEMHCGKRNGTLSTHYTYLLFSGRVNVLREVVVVEALVCEDLEGFGGDPAVKEEDGEVVGVAEVAELQGEVDVTRDQHHGGRREVGAGEATHALAELVVCCVLGHGVDMDHSHL